MKVSRPLRRAARVVLITLPLSIPWGAPGCGGGCGAVEGPPGMSDAELRDWYNAQVSTIPTHNEAWQAEGADAETRARRAWQIFHDARVGARARMQDQIGAERLRARDRAKYGDPDGPSFDFMVEEQRRAGLEGDAVYEAVIEQVARRREKINRLAGQKP